MFRRIAVLSIIISIFSIMLGSALELLPLADQYYNNKSQLDNLNQNKTRLEYSGADLNNALTKSEEQIEKIDNDIRIFDSEIATLEKIIQKDINQKKETEWNMHLINVLNNKESMLLLGTVLGAIAGLWMVSLALVYFWRR